MIAENIPPDTLTHSYCTAASTPGNLGELHDSLCHLGITRMFHFVKTWNLPYSIEDVKPQFHVSLQAHLVKATQPFERLNIDFKGPLKSTNRNTYFLNVIDEYSRFPFVFPCKDVSTQSVIECLCQLFSVFGMPAYIHSDRGASFKSEGLCQFLQSKGIIATSCTTPLTLHVMVKWRSAMEQCGRL